MKNSFNIQKFLHHNSKCHESKLMHRSLSKAFQIYQEHDLKHPNLVDFIVTKQNKLLCLIDRCRWVGERNELVMKPL